MPVARLILMRHGKSDRSDPEARDFDRPLTDRGRRDVPRMADWLGRQDIRPDLVLSSPARRARDTAELLLRRLRLAPETIVFLDAIYEADRAALLRAVRGHEAGTLLLVGHNPGLDALLCHLCREPPPRNVAGKLLTTAAIAVLEFNGAMDLRSGGARLAALARPKEID